MGTLVKNSDDRQDPAAITASSSTTPANNPIVIQMPQMPFHYPYLHPHPNTSIQPRSPDLPSISEFLNNLDRKYNCNDVYSKFNNAFLEEEITVNAIKDLSDDQLVKLGIVKIGWQKNIRQAAQKY